MSVKQQVSRDDGPLYSPGEEMWRLMLPSLDNYQVLCVPYSAGEDVIRSAYRSLMRQFHPDNQVSGDEDVARRVIDAYAVLSDPSEKRSYDATLASRMGSTSSSSDGGRSAGGNVRSGSSPGGVPSDGSSTSSSSTSSSSTSSFSGSSSGGAEPRFERFRWVSPTGGSFSSGVPSRNPWVWLWVLYSSVVLGAFLGSSGLWDLLNSSPSGGPGAVQLPVQAPSFWLGVLSGAVVAVLGVALLRRWLFRWLAPRWALRLSAGSMLILSTVFFSLR